MENFLKLVYKLKDDEKEYVREYDDADSARSDFEYMTQYKKNDYEFVVMEEIETNYYDYESIEIIDAWYADEE